MSPEEMKELETEFKRGYEIYLANRNGVYFDMEKKLKEGKVGTKTIRLDTVLVNSDLIGTSSRRYENKMEELEKKVTDFIEKEGLRKEASVVNGFYVASEGERVAFAGTYCFAAKRPDIFRKLAVDIYGY